MINLGDNFVLNCSKLFHGVFHETCSVLLRFFGMFCRFYFVLAK